MTDLADLVRAGWTVAIMHHADRSQGAPTPAPMIFTVTAQRLNGDAVRHASAKHEHLTVAVATVIEKAKR